MMVNGVLTLFLLGWNISPTDIAWVEREPYFNYEICYSEEEVALNTKALERKTGQFNNLSKILYRITFISGLKPKIELILPFPEYEVKLKHEQPQRIDR